MAAEFRQTSESELELVRDLMRNSFHVGLDTPSLDRSLLQWKYYGVGPTWPGSRSYVLSDKSGMLAHAAILPLQLQLPGGMRSGLGFFDWVASEEHRGVGLLLLKKLTTLSSFILVVGGAEITRQILPRMGFKPWAKLPVYARVLRPVQQSLTRPSWNWKEPLRLARNQIWSLAPLTSARDWSVEVSIPDEETLKAVHQKPGSVNTREFLEHMVRCPAVLVRSLVLRKQGIASGYAVVANVSRQARIADLRLEPENQDDWNAALSAVVKYLLKEKVACEVIALASIPVFENALRANGFHVRDRTPLVVLDTEGQMEMEEVPQIGMLIDDSSYNFFPQFPYVT